MSEEKDPWASLAESLGATPGREPVPPPAAKTPQPPRPERRVEPKAAAPRTTPSWDDLDTSLGLTPAREPARQAEPRRPEPRPIERPAAFQAAAPAEPPQSERRPSEARREFGFDEPPRRTDRANRDERADRDTQDGDGDEPRRDGGQPRSAGDEPAGEDRPRRRRGRRGGRRRGGRGRREDGASLRLDESPVRDGDPGSEPIDDLADERPSTAATESDERPLDEEGRPRRRRRRRGRRGGRRGGEAGETTAPQSPVQRPESGADADDEPLPSGYGRAQAARQPADARDGESRPEGGERRGRRRRRGRGRGEEPTRRSSGEAGGEGSGRRGRRSRRGSGEERTSSTSSLARRSRDDFAPVSRGFEEDDEGLEFLGVEEARDQAPRREARHVEEDDVLVESGLNAVRDVPSWVEAIGIVIAGNLDARSRPRSERADDDRRRR